MSIEKLYDETVGRMLEKNFWDQFGATVFKIVFIIVAGRVLVWIIHKSINKIMMNKVSMRKHNQQRRITTVGKLLKNTISYTIYFIMALMLLAEIGISLGPLIAGAGVVGVAIAFGAQSLVKDVITGLFIVIEDQFAVGDTIKTSGFQGKVEVIGLRTTKLISDTGEVHIIPNSTINQITNYSVNTAKIEIDVTILDNGDIRQTLKVVKESIEQISHSKLIGPIQVQGIEHFDKDEITLRMKIECQYEDLEEVRRSINEHMKVIIEDNQLQLSGE